MPMRSGSSRSWQGSALRFVADSRDMPRAAASASPAAFGGRLPTPNSAITPSPMNLSTLPAGGLDGRAHGAEVAVEQEHDVIGQPVLGEPREGAQVGEQHGDLLLAALEVVGPRLGVARRWPSAAAAGTTATSAVGRVWQASRTLGGAPTRSSTLRSSSLGRRQVRSRPGGDAHAAGGAAAAAAADRGVRDARRSAGLEDRRARLDVDRLPRRIADGDGAVADAASRRTPRASSGPARTTANPIRNQCSMA